MQYFFEQLVVVQQNRTLLETEELESHVVVDDEKHLSPLKSFSSSTIVSNIFFNGIRVTDTNLGGATSVVINLAIFCNLLAIS